MMKSDRSDYSKYKQGLIRRHKQGNMLFLVCGFVIGVCLIVLLLSLFM